MAKCLRIGCMVSAAALAAACQQRTEILFGVITDLKAPDAMDTVQLIVSDANSGVPILAPPPWMLTGMPDQSFNLPGSYGVSSDDGDESPILVDVQGFKNGAVVVERTAIVTLIDNQTLFYRMGLTAGCAAVGDCGSGSTCVEGVCKSQVVDSRSFPPFTADLVTQLTCDSGVNYIDTATSTAMPFAPGAADCSSNLCVEGTCYNPVGNMITQPDAGTGVDAGLKDATQKGGPDAPPSEDAGV